MFQNGSSVLRAKKGVVGATILLLANRRVNWNSVFVACGRRGGAFPFYDTSTDLISRRSSRGLSSLASRLVLLTGINWANKDAFSSSSTYSTGECGYKSRE